ncbi:MAG: type II secretion system protein, partial [Deltaproteobacteria bacterium]|nr:type II secretion system protein [Deltaproteobacteria bacterium]
MRVILKPEGFSYISALIFVSVMGISITAASTYWSTIMKREREKELLFRGDQIRRAIESYYTGAPGGGGKKYSRSLKELLKDPRYPAPRRHLRKLYKDPMDVDREWGFIMASGGRIKGVFSKSKEKPLKVGNFPAEYENFEKAKTYSDWKFVH